MTNFVRLAGAFGVIGVGLGAFGAHGLEEVLIENNRLGTWETATLYLFVHTLALLFLGGLHDLHKTKALNLAAWSWVIGIVVFSGSLYSLSLTNLTVLGAITPLGGVCFIVGWCVLIVIGLKEKSSSIESS